MLVRLTPMPNHRSLLLAVVAATAAVSLCDAARAAAPANEAHQLTFTRANGARIAATGMTATIGYATPAPDANSVAVYRSAAAPPQLTALVTSTNLGTTTATASLDGRAATLSGFGVSQQRAVLSTTTSGPAAGPLRAAEVTLRRRAVANDWQRAASTGGTITSVALHVNAGGAEVRTVNAARCSATAYQLSFATDGSSEESLTLSCGTTTVAGGSMAGVFEDFSGGHTLTSIVLAAGGSGPVFTLQNAIPAEYGLKDGAETYKFQQGGTRAQ